MTELTRRKVLPVIIAGIGGVLFAGCGGGGSSGGGSAPPPGGGGGTTTVGAATRARTNVNDENNWPAFGGSKFTTVGPVSGQLTYSQFQALAADRASVSTGSQITWSNGSSLYSLTA